MVLRGVLIMGAGLLHRRSSLLQPEDSAQAGRHYIQKDVVSIAVDLCVMLHGESLQS